MKANQKQIEVFSHSAKENIPTLMGMLRANQIRSKETFAFEYNSSWLMNNNSCSLDPSLQLFQGLQYAATGKNNFNIFLEFVFIVFRDDFSTWVRGFTH